MSTCHNSMAASTKNLLSGKLMLGSGRLSSRWNSTCQSLTSDVAQFTLDNIIQCLKDNGYGELPEELGQEALDNYYDMRQGKAESIQDNIFREEILTVALQKDTAIDLDEKIRGYWLMRTSNLTEREISGIKIITQGHTARAGQEGHHPDDCCKET